MNNNKNNTNRVLRTNAEREFNAQHSSPISFATGVRVNYLLASDMYLSTDIEKAELNRNIMLIGSSGSGKTEHIKSNILQANMSMVINDPSGRLTNDCTGPLKERGFEVKKFSFVDFIHSHRYNPLDYIYNCDGAPDEDKISFIVKMLCRYICGADDDPTWAVNRDLLKIFSILMTVICECVESNRDDHNKINFITIQKTLSEDYPCFKVKLLDNKNLKEDNPLTYKYYKEMNQTSYELNLQLWKNTAEALKPIAQDPLNRILKNDPEDSQNNIDLNDITNEKTALFINSGLPDKEKLNSCFCSILYAQIIDILQEKTEYPLYRENKVQLYLDEMPSIGYIPNFIHFLTICGNRNVGCTMSIQTIEQLRTIYGGDWETIAGSCDVLIYLGNGDTLTNNFISIMAGERTISSATSRFLSKMTGGKWVEKKRYEPVIAPEDMYRIKKDQCLILLKRESPILANKLPLC